MCARLANRFSALLAQQEQRSGGWPKPPRTCLTIHNLAYQGVFPKTAFGLTNLPANLFQC